jgi:predicted DNA-binding transcriptional regulator AlpA
MLRRSGGRLCFRGLAMERRLLTIQEVIAELAVPRSSFYRWRQLGVGPRCIKLPNGDIRIRRADLDGWLQARERVG